MTRTSSNRSRGVVRGVVPLLALAALSLSACGQDKTITSNSQDGASVANAQKAAAAAVQAGYKGTSTLPDSSPRPAARNKRLIFISSGQNNISSSAPLAGQVEAAKALGWKTQVLDGQSNPALLPGLLRQAIAAKPDAISLQSIDCPTIATPLEEARAAGIKIAASYSFDCDDPKFKGKPLFDAVPVYASSDLAEFIRGFGQLTGEGAIAKFGNKANVLQLNDEEVRILDYTGEGFQRAIKAGGGTITYKTFLAAELGPKLEALVTGELLKNPNINVVKSPYTGATLLGIASGIKKAGKTGKVFVIGGDGMAPELDLMRQGAVDVINVNAPAWVGWATIDSLNSVFTGQKPVASGVGWTLVDANHGLTSAPGKAFEDFPDFRSVYKKAWGI